MSREGARAKYPRFAVEATQEQTTAARQRVLAVTEAAAHKAKIGVDEAAPALRVAVAALPDLAPLLLIAVELRTIVLVAYTREGVKVPRETWARLGVGHAYCEPESFDPKGAARCTG